MKGEVIMVWGVIRILIFTTGFLMGLLLSGFGGASTNSTVPPALNERGVSETGCSRNTFVLVHAQHDQLRKAGHVNGM